MDDLLKADSGIWVGNREMNVATSQLVFAGPYLTDEKELVKFSAAFIDMTRVCPSSFLTSLDQSLKYSIAAVGRSKDRLP